MGSFRNILRFIDIEHLKIYIVIQNMLQLMELIWLICSTRKRKRCQTASHNFKSCKKTHTKTVLVEKKLLMFRLLKFATHSKMT